MAGNRQNATAYVCSGHIHHGASFCGLNRVRQMDILEEIAAVLEVRLLSPNVREQLRAELRRQVDDDCAKVDLVDLRRQLNSAEKELASAEHRLLEVDHDMLAVIQDRIRCLRNRRDELKSMLRAAQESPERRLRVASESVDKAMQLFAKLREAILGASETQIRELLRHLVKKVEVSARYEQRGRKKFWYLDRGTVYLKGENLCGMSP